MCFLFSNISDSALLWIIFENGTLTFSFTSLEFITVEIYEIYFTTTEIWWHLSKKSGKFRENALLEKKFKLNFLEIFHAYILK